jgi:hypothetical protein
MAAASPLRLSLSTLRPCKKLWVQWQRHGVAVRAGEADILRSPAPGEVGRGSAPGGSHPRFGTRVGAVRRRARLVIFVRVSRAQSLIGSMSPGTRPEALTRLLVARSLGRILAHELGHGLLNSSRASLQPPTRARRPRRTRHWDACSYVCAIRNSSVSCHGAPLNCSPIGRPERVNPHGTESWGMPES